MLDKVASCKCPVWYNQIPSNLLSFTKQTKKVLENASSAFTFYWSSSIKHHMPVVNVAAMEGVASYAKE